MSDPVLANVDVSTLDAPVRTIPTDGGEQLEEGTALCLSGGGYRAMLFHLGALWRMHEIGVISALERVSSVSGGSITAGVLALALAEAPQMTTEEFQKLVVEPVRRLAGRTIDVGSVIGGMLLPGSVADKVRDAYDRYLFSGKTLQHLPERPRFVFNATSVQTGALFRFSKPYLADYRVGRVMKPEVSVATAVAASSAFPPVLSPLRMELTNVQDCKGTDLHRSPYTDHAVLTDGGVYDNLGLETAWKRYRTILVSDGGGKMAAEEEPKSDWARHGLRITDLIDNQVRSLRKRQLIESYNRSTTIGPTDPLARKGSYWGIRSDILNYPTHSDLGPEVVARSQELAAIPTRLARMDEALQEALINWGYLICDAAMRSHVDSAVTQPAGLPYPLPR